MNISSEAGVDFLEKSVESNNEMLEKFNVTEVYLEGDKNQTNRLLVSGGTVRDFD